MRPSSDPHWTPAHPATTHPVPRDGRRNCGILEAVLRRQWVPEDGPPPAELIAAVDRLASLPVHLASRLADWLDGLWLGHGNVPDLDHLGYLHGQRVRPDAPTLWDQVPGAVVGRTMVVGTGDHVSVSLIDHELGHCFEQMDDLAATRDWQAIMLRCRPAVAHPRYQDAHEWWAEAYAHVATGELRRLIRMLSGDVTAMEMCWAYYKRELGL